MRKSIIFIMLVCFAFMLTGGSVLKADNVKADKSDPIKSESTTAIDKSQKARAESSYKFGFFFGLKLNIPWIPIALPSEPAPDSIDDNPIKSSTDPNPDIRLRDRDTGDNDGWQDQNK